MSVEQICTEIAKLFGCPCDYSPIDELMIEHSSTFCEDRCGWKNAECWQRYFEIEEVEHEGH